MVDSRSFLFVTLDSCRYDTLERADAPNLKGIGPLHRAMAPGSFTFASHAAMFVGFTPGIAGAAEASVNPKYCKIVKMESGVEFGGAASRGEPFIALGGRNIIDGWKRRGHVGASVLVCADHGDAWGEDGLCKHGFSHRAVLEVPLLFRLRQPTLQTRGTL